MVSAMNELIVYSNSERFKQYLYLTFVDRNNKLSKNKKGEIRSNSQRRGTKCARNIFGLINLKLSQIKNRHKQNNKSREKFNKNIDRLKELLDTQSEITGIDELLNLCPNDEVRNVVIDYIHEHNKRIYLSLGQEYEQFKNTNDQFLTLLFRKYGFDYERLSKEERLKFKINNNNSYEEIELLLKNINRLGLTNVEISKVSSHKLSAISEMISKGIITNEWLRMNVDILYYDNELSELVLRNINLLLGEGINLINYNGPFDFIKSEFVSKNIKLLAFYSLTLTKATTNLSFLSIKDLEKRIEFLYSMGFYSGLSDLNILNHDLGYLLKVKISDYLNIPIDYVGDELSELYCDFTSLIPVEMLSKLNKDTYCLGSLPEFLTEYICDKETLNINGVFVPIKKLLRNISKLEDDSKESCLYAIIYDSYYTFDEIDNLTNALCFKAIVDCKNYI